MAASVIDVYSSLLLGRMATLTVVLSVDSLYSHASVIDSGHVFSMVSTEHVEDRCTLNLSVAEAITDLI